MNLGAFHLRGWPSCGTAQLSCGRVLCCQQARQGDRYLKQSRCRPTGMPLLRASGSKHSDAATTRHSGAPLLHEQHVNGNHHRQHKQHDQPAHHHHQQNHHHQHHASPHQPLQSWLPASADEEPPLPHHPPLMIPAAPGGAASAAAEDTSVAVEVPHQQWAWKVRKLLYLQGRQGVVLVCLLTSVTLGPDAALVLPLALTQTLADRLHRPQAQERDLGSTVFSHSLQRQPVNSLKHPPCCFC